MRNIKLTIEYDGKDFNGWQKQPNKLNIQGEIENFPYNMLHKSSKANMLETCSYIGVGCTGVAYNVLFCSGTNSKHNDNLDNERKFKDLLPYKPFYTALCDTFGKNLNNGVCLFEDNLTQMLSNHSENGEWLEGMPWGGQLEFFEMGIPMGFRNAPVTMLMRDNFRGMPHNDIIKILSGGVILSGMALIALSEMGYGKYLGFKFGKNIDFDSIERMTDHPFNEEAEGMLRDNHQSFWWDTAYGFVKTDDKAQVVADLVDYAENVYKDDEGNELCTVGVFENSLGGRICVMGYYKDSHLHSYPKCRQIKNILKYVSKNSVSYIDSYHSISLYDRSGDKAGFLAINNSYDDAENVILNVAKDVEKLTIVYKDMSEKTILRLKVCDGYSVFNLGNIANFDPVLIKE